MASHAKTRMGPGMDPLLEKKVHISRFQCLSTDSHANRHIWDRIGRVGTRRNGKEWDEVE